MRVDLNRASASILLRPCCLTVSSCGGSSLGLFHLTTALLVSLSLRAGFFVSLATSLFVLRLLVAAVLVLIFIRWWLVLEASL